ncbi:MAG TPA: response regulator transcription factor [Methylomirabilota bacterium]|nr:response regulator transcription factor [Methylomirabilota bacterium]
MNTEAKPRKAIEVAIADKNPLVLSGLSELFEKDERFSLVFTVNSSERFLEALSRIRIHVGIVEWTLPTHGGASLLETLRDWPRPPRVVVYSSSSDPNLARKVMASGGAGFCSKSESPERLLEVAAAVADGQMVFPFVDVRGLYRDPLEELTEKERVMLTALAKGQTNNELAVDLGISVNTVKFHLRNLYDKLSIRNRSQAVAFYYSLRNGSSPE